MAIKEAPKAAVTKSRREKGGADSAAPAVASCRSSIVCSLIAGIEKQNGRHILAAGRQLGWTPLSCESDRSDSRPAAFDRAFCQNIAIAVPGRKAWRRWLKSLVFYQSGRVCSGAEAPTAAHCCSAAAAAGAQP